MTLTLKELEQKDRFIHRHIGPSEKDISDMLKKLKVSSLDDLIKKVVHSTNSHPTADWIYAQVRRTSPKISLGTIYRNLKQLTEEGIIRTIYDGNVTRYDWNIDSHHHLKCMECGDLIDIQLSNEDMTKSIRKEFDFEVSDVEITLFGKCNKHN